MSANIFLKHMDIVEIFFTSKQGGETEPLWILAVILCWGSALVLLGVFGKIIFSKNSSKALHKTFKKSSFGLKFLGILYLLLLWAQLESLPVLSMRIWFAVLSVCVLYFVYRKVRYLRRLQKRIQKGSQERREFA